MVVYCICRAILQYSYSRVPYGILTKKSIRKSIAIFGVEQRITIFSRVPAVSPSTNVLVLRLFADVSSASTGAIRCCSGGTGVVITKISLPVVPYFIRLLGVCAPRGFVGVGSNDDHDDNNNNINIINNYSNNTANNSTTNNE